MLKRCRHLILSEHGRQTPTELISLLCGSKSFKTIHIKHFRFHCEILTINLTKIFYISKQEL